MRTAKWSTLFFKKALVWYKQLTRAHDATAAASCTNHASRRETDVYLHQSTGDGTNLHHGRHVGLDVGLLDSREGLVVNG